MNMKLRALLIAAILTGVSVILLGELQLRPKLKALLGERDQLTASLQVATAERAAAETALRAKTAEFDEARQTLAAKEQERAAAVVERDQAREAAARSQRQLTQAEAARQAVEVELAQWKFTGRTPQEVVRMSDEWKRLKEENAALTAALQASLREARQWSNLVATVFGPEDPPMPLSLRGRVTAVDPKWGFVVLDVGETQQVKPRGILLVSREGRLVAKVRVSRVECDQSIAEIIPGSKLGEIVEGDVVLPRAPLVSQAGLSRS